MIGFIIIGIDLTGLCYEVQDAELAREELSQEAEALLTRAEEAEVKVNAFSPLFLVHEVLGSGVHPHAEWSCWVEGHRPEMELLDLAKT